jgi:hypothetical protein
MSVSICLKRSTSIHKRPTPAQIQSGELALNENRLNGGLYTLTSSGLIGKLGPTQVSAETPNAAPTGSSGNSPGELWLQPNPPGSGLPFPSLYAYDGSTWLRQAASRTVLPFDGMTTAGGAAAPPSHVWGLIDLYSDRRASGNGWNFLTAATSIGNSAEPVRALNWVESNQKTMGTYLYDSDGTIQVPMIIDQVSGRTLSGGAIANGNPEFADKGFGLPPVKVGSMYGLISITSNSNRKFRDAQTATGYAIGLAGWWMVQFAYYAGIGSSPVLMETGGTTGGWSAGGTSIYLTTTTNIRVVRLSGAIRVEYNCAVPNMTGQVSTFTFWDSGTNGGIAQYSYNGGAWTTPTTTTTSTGGVYSANYVFWGGTAVSSNATSNFGNSNTYSALAMWVGLPANIASQTAVRNAATLLHATVSTQ